MIATAMRYACNNERCKAYRLPREGERPCRSCGWMLKLSSIRTARGERR